MTDVLVDSNVILDILTEDPTWFDWSASVLSEYAEQGELVINPIIYSLFTSNLDYTRLMADSSAISKKVPLDFQIPRALKLDELNRFTFSSPASDCEKSHCKPHVKAPATAQSDPPASDTTIGIDTKLESVAMFDRS
jgi:hypothetical protein